MRRIVMLLGVTVLTVMVAAGIAVAVNKTCGNNLPCRGTENDDVLNERIGNREKDRILALDGRDRLQAVNFTNDRDRLEGGKQGDRIFTSDGDARDAARGGRGRDTCLINTGDANSSCERLRTVGAGVMATDFDEVTSSGNESTDPGGTTSEETTLEETTSP
jgi:hypothetical protein